MKTESIKISIIMPVYNAGKYLKPCVESILAQNFSEFELLLIDDGSNDGSEEVCDYFASSDTRVRVFHRHNSGICASRNFGLSVAKGEYIGFADHDDLLKAGFLKENYLEAKENNADIVKFGRKEILVREDKILRVRPFGFRKELLIGNDIRDSFLKLRFEEVMTCVWDGFFRRQFLIDNKITFDTSYTKGGEDGAFCDCAFSCAQNVLIRDGIYYLHYVRIGYSTSTKIDLKKVDRLNLLVEQLHRSMKKMGIRPTDYPEYYVLNFLKGYIYPMFSHYVKSGYSINYIKTQMYDIRTKYALPSFNLFKGFNISKSWLFFYILYICKFDQIIYVVVNKKIKEKSK